MEVQTVTGKVSPQELGIALVHEHLLIDLRCLFSAPKDAQRKYLVDEPVRPSLRDALVSDPYQSKDNLLLQDAKLAAKELIPFAELGGRTIIDLTTRTIGPFPDQLLEIASDTKLNIIASTGFYVGKAHPKWIDEAQIGQIEEFMLKEITEGIDETTVKAGIIGELGTSSPITPNEEKVLSAAARVQRQTGLAINVHLAIFGREGHNILNFLEADGVDLTRVVLSHVDESNDRPYVQSLAERGAFVELDTFGSEFAFSERGQREPNDWERLDLLVSLLEAGLAEHILVSQDVCNKIHLCEYGGYGYAHILRTIVPRMKKQEVPDSTIDQILVKNPAKMLSGVSL